ncbi:HEAT repeat domain-containing protein [Actinacidiphila glaucinigra]|uniref:HEAT repeat domain-containing protein n=1 Tax=Actinacidiphila glaucinigra TaxID=235986 RepID=A0A239KUW2_9ACTN|nr:hypothetical protein [Actinacidiphila glaucinigra]SNT21542.1 hypothetical protein SAMN05216252_11728 [Actinacidiphila glaucinigra]
MTAALAVLEQLPWDEAESAFGRQQAKDLRRGLRSLVLKRGAATEEDYFPLSNCFAPGGGRIGALAAATLPFAVALATDLDMGSRSTVVEMLGHAAQTASEDAVGAMHAGWAQAWNHHSAQIRALLGDPVPAVRRAALPLADGVDQLLERWNAEADPSVRLPLLLALGTAAASSTDAGSLDRAMAVLTEELRAGTPVMQVAAVHAWAAIDPEAPVRELDLLVEVLSEPATRPQFEANWYLADDGIPRTREDVLAWTAALYNDAQRSAALSFAVRLIDAAHQREDALLCQAALDEGWQLLVVQPSVASALLPRAGELLADTDDGVRYRAAHLLAVLGTQAAAYADQLATLLDDTGQAEYLEGTVGDHARWALARIGDRRALPGLVEQLYAPYEDDYSRGYTAGDPRLPEVEDVLIPMRDHAAGLLPAIRQRLKKDGADGPLTGNFLKVLIAWGPAAAPALPEVVALLNDARRSLTAVDALVAMGPAASSAEPAVRECTVLDHPGNHQMVAWAAWRLSGDRDTALRHIGEAVLTAEPPHPGPIALLGDFGPAAAPYANHVRQGMEHGSAWVRIPAAVALWAITGNPGPSVSVLEEYLHALADGSDAYGDALRALQALLQIGTVTAETRALLRSLQNSDRRLSNCRDYRAFLEDEELRSMVDGALALPQRPSDVGP